MIAWIALAVVLVCGLAVIRKTEFGRQFWCLLHGHQPMFEKGGIVRCARCLAYKEVPW